jgi:hypothetical protein
MCYGAEDGTGPRASCDPEVGASRRCSATGWWAWPSRPLRTLVLAGRRAVAGDREGGPMCYGAVTPRSVSRAARLPAVRREQAWRCAAARFEGQAANPARANARPELG